MRWDEFLNTADRLARLDGGRLAVSRQPWLLCCFSLLPRVSAAHGVDVGQAGACHSNLYTGLNNCGVGATVPIASRVNDLRKHAPGPTTICGAGSISIRRLSRGENAPQ